MNRIGIIGCGNIAPAYMRGCQAFPDELTVAACADIDMARAQEFGTDYDLRALSVDDLLAAPDIDIVVNLTIPTVHADVSTLIARAGKHVYSEKPLGISLDDAKRALQAAEEAGVRIGCAPDTFLGGGGQTCRLLIDDGAIGQPVAATAFMASRGPARWHPNPFFFFQHGGGPLLDLGPYYITALVNLLGPVATVSAMTQTSFPERIAGHESIQGQVIPVDVATHVAGTLRFATGPITTLIMSWEVWQHTLPRIEVYGSEGTLSVPDPNTFGGPVRLWQTRSQSWREVPLTQRSDVQRGLGVVDMARAIVNSQPHRASGQLAYHVLEVMLALEQASDTGQQVDIISSVAQPARLAPTT